VSDVPALRVSDAEREAVVERLRGAGAEGRLDPDELGERVAAADRARTHADLAALVADLPEPPRPPAPRVPGDELRRRLATFLPPNIICVVIWAATNPGGYFWPMWVMLGTGIGLVCWLIPAMLGVRDDDEQAERLEPPEPTHHGLPRG
jgi:Domain of unknown function (DUF1707)